MSGMVKALTVFTSPGAPAERQLMQNVLADLLLDGCVRFKSVVSCHDHLVRRYGFTLVRNVTWGVRPGGRHLFFQHGHVLLRIKTSGTPMRTEPHMTISVTDGLEWPDEVAKLSRHGDLIPKLGGVNRADFRSLMRLGPDAATISAVDDAWADACHFNFVSGFDGSGAAGLPVKKK